MVVLGVAGRYAGVERRVDSGGCFGSSSYSWGDFGFYWFWYVRLFRFIFYIIRVG